MNVNGQLFNDSFVAVYLEGQLTNEPLPSTSFSCCVFRKTLYKLSVTLFSGFTVEKSSQIFLITCHHCLFIDNVKRVNQITAYFHTNNTNDQDVIMVEKFIIAVCDNDNNPNYIMLDERTDAIAFPLDPLNFPNVIWNHVDISDKVVMNYKPFLHPGTRVLAVGFPKGLANKSNTLRQPFWLSFFVAAESNMNENFFIHGVLPEGMSGGPIFIYKSDSENSIGGFQGLHTLQFIGMVYAGYDDAEVFRIVPFKKIQELLT